MIACHQIRTPNPGELGLVRYFLDRERGSLMLKRWMTGLVMTLCAAAGAVAATAPTALELETQAFDWMGKGNYPKARFALDRAYQLTPVAQRNRAMVLNRAILDVTQKSLVMRGLKELSAYLIMRPQEDEEATNILGGGLN